MVNRNQMHTSNVAKARNLTCVDEVGGWNDMVICVGVPAQQPDYSKAETQRYNVASDKRQRFPKIDRKKCRMMASFGV